MMLTTSIQRKFIKEMILWVHQVAPWLIEQCLEHFVFYGRVPPKTLALEMCQDPKSQECEQR